jgi:phenylpropionate dioxygenase-like ring-hydroxylating dioxygenase large terminal subunit
MGNTLRHYWVPALLSNEVPEPDGPPARVRLLGEDLVAYRDTEGVVGLIGAYCPHRMAPMYYGRNERGGLRCVYHGWKFDRTGRCTDMPTEPPTSNFKNKVQIESYPTWEGGGIVWAYLGPADRQPPPPLWELTRTPETHRFVSRTVQDCNWLQALEGGLDSAHAMIMHNERIGDLSFLDNYDRLTPKLEVQPTDYGFTYTGIRELGDDRWVRLYQFFMPFTAMRGRVAPLRGATTPPEHPTMCGHLWVPMDDVTTMVFNFIYSADPAIALPLEFALHNEREDGRHPDDLLPDLRLRANAANDYFIDRKRQKIENFTGIEGINTQDVAIQEGMGPIVDRSREHLGSTDRAIIQMRRLQLEAIKAVEAGMSPKGADTSNYADARAVDRIVHKSRVDATLAEDSRARF